jgi:hypothetical protein
MDVPPMLEKRNYRPLNSCLRPLARARRPSVHRREELVGRKVRASARRGTGRARTGSACPLILARWNPQRSAQGSFTNAKDFNGAVAKLDAAALKLSEGKSADAAAKVGDFQSLLTALSTAPKPKLDPSVADRLVVEAHGVVDCINAIDTT